MPSIGQYVISSKLEPFMCEGSVVERGWTRDKYIWRKSSEDPLTEYEIGKTINNLSPNILPTLARSSEHVFLHAVDMSNMYAFESLEQEEQIDIVKQVAHTLHLLQPYSFIHGNLNHSTVLIVDSNRSSDSCYRQPRLEYSDGLVIKSSVTAVMWNLEHSSITINDRVVCPSCHVCSDDLASYINDISEYLPIALDAYNSTVNKYDAIMNL